MRIYDMIHEKKPDGIENKNALWYLCSKVASLETPDITILDETYRANIREPIYSKYRLMHKQGLLYDYSGPSPGLVMGMLNHLPEPPA